MRPWEEIRCELHKCFEKTEQIKTARMLKEKFATFNDDLQELRYSDFVTAEMVCETLQNVLAKFQPLCHKIVAAESQGEEDQGAGVGACRMSFFDASISTVDA